MFRKTNKSKKTESKEGDPKTTQEVEKEEDKHTHEEILEVFGQVPEYKDFFECPEKFERIEMHMTGVRVKADADKGSFVGQPSCLFKKSTISPHLISKTIGDDTGSTDFFEIGTHEFLVSTIMI